MLPVVTDIAARRSFQSEHWQPEPARIGRALVKAREVVSDPSTTDNLARYYTVDSEYAGATHAGLTPNDPATVTPTDLLAVTTLSVKVSPSAIRNFARAADDIAAKLDVLDPNLRLENADPRQAAEAMASFYALVKTHLRPAGARSSDPWVTASKVCARKRPNLFPVRDNVVLDLLGLPKTYAADWPAFQALVADDDLSRKLDQQVAEAGHRPGVDVGDPTLRLRHLDAALWMYGVRGAPRH